MITKEQLAQFERDAQVTMVESDMQYFVISANDVSEDYYRLIVVNEGENLMVDELCCNIMSALVAMHSFVMNEYACSFKQA